MVSTGAEMARIGRHNVRLKEIMASNSKLKGKG